MYLSIQNQLMLLHDLLDEQITYKKVNINEYKQIKKLVQAIITNRHVNAELRTVLPEIYYYGMKGENAQSSLNHIIENEHKIRKWLSLINRVNLHRSS